MFTCVNRKSDSTYEATQHPLPIDCPVCDSHWQNCFLMNIHIQTWVNVEIKHVEYYSDHASHFTQYRSHPAWLLVQY